MNIIVHIDTHRQIHINRIRKPGECNPGTSYTPSQASISRVARLCREMEQAGRAETMIGPGGVSWRLHV